MKIMGLILIVSFSASAYSANSEREDLSNYLRELNKIDRLFLSAKNNSSSNSPNRFKYIVFEKDLAEMKSKIKEYLDLPNRSPRTLLETQDLVSKKNIFKEGQIKNELNH